MFRRRDTLLVILVIISLVTNAVLVVQWLRFREQALLVQRSTRSALSQAISDLDSLQESDIRIGIAISQSIPLSTSVPFRARWAVPIRTEMPVRQTASTTAQVSIPGLGTQVPVQVAVPLSLTVPVSLSVPITVDLNAPVRTTVPISLTAPVRVDLSASNLGPYLGGLRNSLVALRDALAP